jgi:aconitase A
MLPSVFRNALRRVIVFCFINFAAETRGRLDCTKPGLGVIHTLGCENVRKVTRHGHPGTNRD